MPTPTMRPATAADALAIAALLGHLGYPTEPHDVRARLDAMQSAASVVHLAIDDGGRPVGLVAVQAFHAIHASAPVALIMALVVAPDARDSGVGRALVNFARTWAMELGCERLMVTSAEHRADAHAFYPACGMPYTGRRFATMLQKPAT